jgi:DNA-binding response OmpR family regulator
MNEHKQTILIIEDDQTLREGLVEAFGFHEYQTLSAADGLRGLELWGQEKPDLIILDLMLPDRDGYEICRRIRSDGDHLPILMLTAKGQEADKLLGFELGADDYMTKPFSLRELVARVKALLRRAELTRCAPDSAEEGVLIGLARVHLGRFTVEKGGRVHDLSPRECAILRLLLRHPGQVLDRYTVIDRVWGHDYDPTPRTIDNFINKLRKKLEDDPAHPRHLLTVHGAGYKLCP